MNAAGWLLIGLLCSGFGASAASAQTPAAGRATESAAPAATALQVDLNQAGIAELTELPGIGPKRAEAIIAYRESHGGFQSATQLLKIKGIGRAMLRKLRDLVTISAPHRSPANAQGAKPSTNAGGTEDIHRVR